MALPVVRTSKPDLSDQSSRRRWLAAGILVLGAASLGGCALPTVERAVVDFQKAVDPPPSSAMPAAPGAPAVAQPPGTPLTASQVMANSTAALKQAKNAHVRATREQNGDKEELDFVTTMDGATFSLNLTEGGTTAQLVRVAPSIYIKGDKAFWSKNGGATASAMAGKWVKMTGPKGDALAGQLKLGYLLELPQKIPGDQAVATPTTEAGKAVYRITDKNVASGELIIDAATWLPVRIQGAGVVVAYDSWNATAPVQAPTAAVSITL